MSHSIVVENLGKGKNGKFIICSRYGNPELHSDEMRKRPLEGLGRGR